METKESNTKHLINSIRKGAQGYSKSKDEVGDLSTLRSDQSSKREPIAYLRATVEFPLYAGDSIDREPGRWNDFIYEEPGILGDQLAVCRRKCKTISAQVLRKSDFEV